VIEEQSKGIGYAEAAAGSRHPSPTCVQVANCWLSTGGHFQFTDFTPWGLCNEEATVHFSRKLGGKKPRQQWIDCVAH
jgi:hypothetical protein